MAGTVHYLRPSAPGPVRIAVEIIKVGRHYSTAMVHIRRLRARLEPNASHPQLIVTVRGVGYRFRG